MKVLLDTLGCPVGSGGMRLLAQEVLLSWAEAFPDDELVVLGEGWASEADIANVTVVPWRAGRVPHRVVGQSVVAPLIARHHRVDCHLSLSPVLSPFASRRTAAHVVPDWRHLRRPDELSRARRLYRHLWTSSVARAAITFAISEKTARETAAVVPSARIVVDECGRDHARRWPSVAPSTDRPAPYVMAYGHQANKRPDLVLRAVAEIRGTERPHLVVLGARGGLRDRLIALAHDLGIGSTCTFPGFVEDTEYRRLVRGAAAIVLASTDEGFGLPVAEAEYLGVPAVICEDSGVDDLHPGALVARPIPSDVADRLRTALERDAATAPGRVRTWREHVEVLRQHMVTITEASAAVHPQP